MHTDNLKGFRRRNMIKKLDILMKQIKDCIDYCYDDALYESDNYKNGIIDLKEQLQHGEFAKERISELESQYSMIWRIMIQLQKGIRTSKTDLKYVNEVHKQIVNGEF